MLAIKLDTAKSAKRHVMEREERTLKMFLFLRWFDKDTCEKRAAGYTKFNASPYVFCYDGIMYDIDNSLCPDANDIENINWGRTTCSSKAGSRGVDYPGSNYFFVSFVYKFQFDFQHCVLENKLECYF